MRRIQVKESDGSTALVSGAFLQRPHGHLLERTTSNKALAGYQDSVWR
jgi:hypothetical protein